MTTANAVYSYSVLRSLKCLQYKTSTLYYCGYYQNDTLCISPGSVTTLIGKDGQISRFHFYRGFHSGICKPEIVKVEHILQSQ